ncbi:MAG TPA: hypothetical protein VHT27_14660 [Solirubrobacteraceae bacterium]|nr:hypothetical protein [Solirubrobacteraceae bacterium]
MSPSASLAGSIVEREAILLVVRDLVVLVLVVVVLLWIAREIGRKGDP